MCVCVCVCVCGGHAIIITPYSANRCMVRRQSRSVRSTSSDFSCSASSGASELSSNQVGTISFSHTLIPLYTHSPVHPGSERHEFGQLLKSLTNSLPDDDSQLSVFDYYVDESGEWDVWQSRLLPLATPPPVDLVGGVFVDTTDTVSEPLTKDDCFYTCTVLLHAQPCITSTVHT